ncbi:MAG TPA: iron-containing redox enzyme family protein [Burkholderiaceae bacterium]
MSNLAQVLHVQPPAATASAAVTAKALYGELSRHAPDGTLHAQARAFLDAQLTQARGLSADLPLELDAMPDWIAARTEAVGAQYRAYLNARQHGGPRRYFTNKAHALHFIRGVAPTKLVDGAWLYGLLPRWNDAAFYPLIKTYLEELGDGVPDKNHVQLYKRLLAAHGCEHWQDLSEAHFTQGAIQLALAYDAEHFLPELIGYNLGYEQLPLHLLITSYELNELGIDPYYFTLHVTVDNAATGHAMKAYEGLRELMPRVGDASAFYRRVLDGYRLNDLGECTTSVIAGFDLEAELVAILAAKAKVGKNMHSDYCRVAGRTVNDWLADPAQIPDFLHSLEQNGWIKRGEPAENSRFWRLIHGERADMFGVFSAYEQQVLRDWIHAVPTDGTALSTVPRIQTYRALQRSRDALGQGQTGRPHGARGIIRHHVNADANAGNQELRLLEQQVAELGSKAQAMDMLAALMGPHNHHTAPGLMATRLFSKLLD